MLEGGRSSLDAIVQPGCTVLVLIEGDGGSLAADNGHALDNGDFVPVRMLGEGGSAGLKAMSVMLRMEVGRVITIPAAPPPTMTTFFFLPFLSNSSEDMIEMIAIQE